MKSFFRLRPQNLLYAPQIFPNKRLVVFKHEHIMKKSEKIGYIKFSESVMFKNYGCLFIVMKDKMENPYNVYESIDLGPHTYKYIGVHLFRDDKPVCYIPYYGQSDETVHYVAEVMMRRNPCYHTIFLYN